MESYHLPQFPSSYSSIHIALFKDVKNSASLRKRLVAASTMEGSEGDQERDKLDYAFIEGNMVSQLKQPGGPLIKQESASPRKIVNRDQLLTAIYSALQAASTETLKTKTIHSEVLLSLHPSSNPQINDALKKFGISPSSKNVILVRIGSPCPSVNQNPVRDSEKKRHEQSLVDAMTELVDGDITSLNKLGDTDVDWKSLRKLYKLNEMDLTPNAPSSDQEKRILSAVITSTIATKSVAA